MWFFTVTSIGNSGALTPSYGVMELLLSSMMVYGLFRVRSELQACSVVITPCRPPSCRPPSPSPRTLYPLTLTLYPHSNPVPLCSAPNLVP